MEACYQMCHDTTALKTNWPQLVWYPDHGIAWLQGFWIERSKSCYGTSLMILFKSSPHFSKEFLPYFNSFEKNLTAASLTGQYPSSKIPRILGRAVKTVPWNFSGYLVRLVLPMERASVLTVIQQLWEKIDCSLHDIYILILKDCKHLRQRGWNGIKKFLCRFCKQDLGEAQIIKPTMLQKLWEKINCGLSDRPMLILYVLKNFRKSGWNGAMKFLWKYYQKVSSEAQTYENANRALTTLRGTWLLTVWYRRSYLVRAWEFLEE